MPARERHSLLAVDLGLLANAVLAVAKVATGLLGRSPALLADGINSASDVVYYVVVRVFMVFARQPADAEHPYGHERLESIGAVVVGSFVVVTGLSVLADSGQRTAERLLAGAQAPVATAAALWVALGTVALKLLLFRWTRRIGRSTANPTVAALALDHRNDVLAASAAALGILCGRLGLPWADPLAGALVALVILRTGVEILRESSSDLMGGRLGAEIEARVRAWLLELPGVRAVEEVRAHAFGPYLVLNVTIGVDGSIPVAAGDAIADAVERTLHERVEFLRAVHVHYHPARAP
jgi:cation diffusion facilitator family transporter